MTTAAQDEQSVGLRATGSARTELYVKSWYDRGFG
jgi:hypothetical protein